MCEQDTIKTVMVLGATGNLGTYLLPKLENAGFGISVLSRSAAPANTPSHITHVQSDYTLSSLTHAFKGQDAVVATIATQDVSIQSIIADACVAAGVKRFLPSEYGSDTSVVKEDDAGFLKAKAELLNHVRSKEHEGLGWTAVYTGGWVDWLLPTEFLLFDLKSKSGTLVGSGNNTFTVSTISMVVRSIVNVLLNPALTKNQCVNVSSYNLTQNTILEALERIGREKFTIERMSLDKLYEQGDRHVKEGMWDKGYVELVAATIYCGRDVVNFGGRAEKWKGALGLEEEEGFEEMIHRVLADAER